MAGVEHRSGEGETSVASAGVTEPPVRVHRKRVAAVPRPGATVGGRGRPRHSLFNVNNPIVC
jgi:hypothetical protein